LVEKRQKDGRLPAWKLQNKACKRVIRGGPSKKTQRRLAGTRCGADVTTTKWEKKGGKGTHRGGAGKSINVLNPRKGSIQIVK